MGRSRVITQSQALFVSPSPATGNMFLSVLGEDQGINNATGLNRVVQIKRVQTVNFGETLERADVNQLGELAATDRVILSSPVANMDFTYLPTDGFNELQLGFITSGDISAITKL